jgi:uncharacterized protein
MEEMKNEEIKQTSEQSLDYSKDARMWAMFCHISALAVFVIPFVGHILGPLLIWILKKEEFPFVDDQGKEALNFQISITIYGIISSILIFIVIGIPILIVLGLFALIMVVIAAISAYDGKAYRYPLTIRIIK